MDKVMVWPNGTLKDEARKTSILSDFDHVAIFETFPGYGWDIIIVMPGWEQLPNEYGVDEMINKILPTKLKPGGELVIT